MAIPLVLAWSMTSAGRAGAQPVSTSGTSITSPSGGDASAAGAARSDEATRETSARLRVLEARLAADEELAKQRAERLGWLERLTISGFVQPQLLVQSYNAAASPNTAEDGALFAGIGANAVIAKADGTSTNGTYFRLRRAFLRTEFMPTDYARVVFEIDPAPIGASAARADGGALGAGTIARNVEAIGIARLGDDAVTEYGVGVFRVPFGREIGEYDADRLFIEHSWAEQNMFPGEFDTGARAHASLFQKKLQATFAVLNGSMLGEKTFALLPDLSRSKDVVGRITYDMGLVASGVSAYYGHGQNLEVSPLRFKEFPRWAINVELRVRRAIVDALGATSFTGELTRAQNMDRGGVYAYALPPIPLLVGDDVADRRELGAYARLEQELTRWVTLGARWDYYTPDTAQADNGRHTLSFAGAVHFTKGLQMMLEFDHAMDRVHRPGGAVSTKLIETGSGVLQARF